MVYKANVIRIMIASPGDVVQERRLIRDVIHEWNAIHAEDRKIVLMPVGWESDSSPDMGDRSQAIINKQLLETCDLLVATFWTRLGSPTGTSSSGTVEEIEKHLAAGKPAMIYFSSEPVRLDSVDNAQYEALVKFKDELRGRGLVVEYETLADFRGTFSRHLAQTIIRSFVAGAGAEDEKPITPSSPVPAIGETAKAILREAADDPHGVILVISTISGIHVQTNRRTFADGRDARSSAMWRAAVADLAGLGLIEDRTGKGEVYFVTDDGYKVIEALRAE